MTKLRGNIHQELSSKTQLCAHIHMYMCKHLKDKYMQDMNYMIIHDHRQHNIIKKLNLQ